MVGRVSASNETIAEVRAVVRKWQKIPAITSSKTISRIAILGLYKPPSRAS